MERIQVPWNQKIKIRMCLYYGKTDWTEQNSEHSARLPMSKTDVKKTWSAIETCSSVLQYFFLR